MNNLEDELRSALRIQAQALHVPERLAVDRSIVEPPRQPRHRWIIAAACLVLIAVGVVALTLRPGGDPEPAPPADSVVPEVTAPTSVVNGWVAVDAIQDVGRDIYLVRPGEAARRLDIAGSDTGDEACPAWSPDGTRLLFGRLTAPSNTAVSFDAELVIVPIAQDGMPGDPTTIGLDGFEIRGGFDGHPCGIWAPDGRWVAFGGGGDVWVVDTKTGEIRRLPDLRPSDLEWRPGTDQLTIAGDMGTSREAPTLSTPVSIYTVSTGELGQLGSVDAAEFTWSPDGSTLGYQGGEDGPGELRLIDADGTNDRLLVDRGEAIHGIGPVWSPLGDRIAYQRVVSRERHEVVLASVADGNETVIEPPQTDGPNGPATWYPYSVSWSPDGTTLLYTAWNESGGGTITVPADSPTDVTVLSDTIGPGDYYSHRWVPVQRWGQLPGPAGAKTLAKGDDVGIEGFSGLNSRTLSIDVEQQDGVAAGEFVGGSVVVTIQCAGITTGGKDLVLGGVVTENSDGDGTLDGVTVAVGNLHALVIRKDPPPIGQRVTLSQPEISFGELASEHTGSCVIAVPIDPDAPPIGSPANTATTLMTAVPGFLSNQ